MIIICVAVRMKSSRCPEKAMADLYGKPLIHRLVERVQKSEYAHEVVICTSTNKQDDVLADFAEKEDLHLVRGGELDVMGRFLAAAEALEADHIVRVTGDNPLTDANLIDDMIDLHLNYGADYTRCGDAPKGTKPEIVRVSALKDLYTKIDPDGSEYMTWQLMELENKRIYGSGLARPDVRLTCDTPEDLARLQRLYEHYKGYPPELPEIIKWYDSEIH